MNENTHAFPTIKKRIHPVLIVMRSNLKGSDWYHLIGMDQDNLNLVDQRRMLKSEDKVDPIAKLLTVYEDAQAFSSERIAHNDNARKIYWHVNSICQCNAL